MLADLLVMIAADFSLPPAVRAEAAAALAGDLEHFGELTARSMATRLDNAGFEVPLELAYEDAERLPSPELHEAAIRQGNTFARDRLSYWMRWRPCSRHARSCCSAGCACCCVACSGTGAASRPICTGPCAGAWATWPPATPSAVPTWPARPPPAAIIRIQSRPSASIVVRIR